MGKLLPVKWRDLVKRLRKLGFEGPYYGGKHPYMVRGSIVITIPNQHQKEVSVDLLSRILRQSDISREEWFQR